MPRPMCTAKRQIMKNELIEPRYFNDNNQMVIFMHTKNQINKYNGNNMRSEKLKHVGITVDVYEMFLYYLYCHAIKLSCKHVSVY